MFWGFCRSWRLHGCVSSDKDPLTVEARAANLPAPANIPSQEEKHYRKPQIRRAGLSPEEPAPHLVLRLGLASPELAAAWVRQLR